MKKRYRMEILGWTLYEFLVFTCTFLLVSKVGYPALIFSCFSIPGIIAIVYWIKKLANDEEA